MRPALTIVLLLASLGFAAAQSGATSVTRIPAPSSQMDSDRAPLVADTGNKLGGTTAPRLHGSESDGPGTRSLTGLLPGAVAAVIPAVSPVELSGAHLAPRSAASRRVHGPRGPPPRRR